MNENKQNTTLLTVIAVATLLVAVVGSTFAYFTAQSTTASTTVVTAQGGKLAMTIDGSTNWTAPDNFEPSALPFATHTFSIEAKYDVNMDIPFTINFVYDNPFITTDIKALLTNTTGNTTGYELTSKPFETQASLARGNGKTTALATGKFLGSAVKSAPKGEVTKTLTFRLELFFPDTGSNQNQDRTKTFRGKLQLATDEAVGKETTATVATTTTTVAGA